MSQIDPTGEISDRTITGLGTGLVGCLDDILELVTVGSNLQYDESILALDLASSISITGLNMNSNKITGVANGTNSADAVNYGQLSGLGALYLPLAGGTMSGAIAMGSNKITGLAGASSTNDAVNYGQLLSVTAAYLPLAGGAMSGTINSQDILPTVNLNYSLGSSMKNWLNIYAQQIYATSVDANQLNGIDLTVSNGSQGNIYTTLNTISNTVTNTDIFLAPSGTGRVSLNAAPTSTLHAATKGYVDAAVAASYIPPIVSSTTNAIVRWANSSGNALANSAVLIDSTGNMSNIGGGSTTSTMTLGNSSSTSDIFALQGTNASSQAVSFFEGVTNRCSLTYLHNVTPTSGRLTVNSTGRITLQANDLNTTVSTTMALNSTGALSFTNPSITYNNATRQIGSLTSSTIATTQTLQCTGTGQSNIFLSDGTNSTNIRHWANFGYSEIAIPWECYFTCSNYYLRPTGGFKVYDTIGASSYTLEYGSSSATAATMFFNSTASSTQTIQFRGAGSVTGSVAFQQNATAANRTLTLNCASGSTQINAASLAPNTTAVTSLGTSSLKFTSLNTTSLNSSTASITWTDANSLTRKLASEEIFAFVNSGTYALTNTSGVSVDNTTGLISFTVPSSGAVLISVYGGILENPTAPFDLFIGLSTNSGAQVYTSWDWGYISTRTYTVGLKSTPYFSRVYAGLTPGTAYTLYLKYRLSAAGSIDWKSGNISPAVSTYGTITMSVRYLN